MTWGSCPRCGRSVWFTTKNGKINPTHVRWHCLERAQEAPTDVGGPTAKSGPSPLALPPRDGLIEDAPNAFIEEPWAVLRAGVGAAQEPYSIINGRANGISMDALAQQMAKARVDRNMTQGQLAERLGVKQSMISMIETGEVTGDAEDETARYSEALGKRIRSWIDSGAGPRKKSPRGPYAKQRVTIKR